MKPCPTDATNKRKRISLFITLALAVNAIHSSSAAPPDSPKMEICPVAPIKLPSQKPPGKAEDASIAELINNLAKINSPDFGFSPTLSVNAFAPIPSIHEESTFVLTDHRLKESNALIELVKLGPKALPRLLQALNDQTPTKLIITHDPIMGVMWFHHELTGNPANHVEQQILVEGSKLENSISGDSLSSLDSYKLKIGDVCLVIIGQIVGRPYEAIRYQPTARVVINSPIQDTNLARQVQAIWSDNNPAQHLLDSLLLDYASRGVSHSWGLGSLIQCRAAMRLLYYFPQQTTNLLANRLRGLNVEKNSQGRDVTNGVNAKDFIHSVSWSDEPAIQSELTRIIEITGDPEILDVAAEGMGSANRTIAQKRLAEFISNLPETEPGPFGEGYNLLVRLGHMTSDNARPIYERYLAHASLQRERSMCRVLIEVHGEWSVDLLAPLLKDTRPAEGWTYGVFEGQNEPRLPIRICDEAAITISHNYPKLSFNLVGDHENLDRQIQMVQAQIKRHAY